MPSRGESWAHEWHNDVGAAVRRGLECSISNDSIDATHHVRHLRASLIVQGSTLI